MKFTIDASVHLNALNSHEEGSAESRRLIEAIHGDPSEQDESPHEVYPGVRTPFMVRSLKGTVVG